MRKILIAASLALLSLTGCAGLGLPTSPAAVAGSTVLDEQGALGVELAYKALRTALELAVDSGALQGEAAVRAAALDNRAYGAVFAARAAYRAGNAVSYAQAVRDARAAITAALAAIGSKSNV